MMLILGIFLSGAALIITNRVYESATHIFGRKGRDVIDESKYRLALGLLLVSSVVLGMAGTAGYMQWLQEDNVTMRIASSALVAGGAFYMKVSIWDREKPIWMILSIVAIAIPVITGICIAAG